MLSDNWAKGTIQNFILFNNSSFMHSCHSVSREEMQWLSQGFFFLGKTICSLVKHSLFAYVTQVILIALYRF